MSIRSTAAGIAVGASLATAVGIAYASIPDSGGVIHACYQNVTGASKPVKLLNTSQKTTCPNGWLPVSWNQQGVPGPPGPSGTSIILRSRASGIDAVPNDWVDVALSPSTWTQSATEVDLLTGSIRVTAPATCNGYTGNADLQTETYVDGNLLPDQTDINIPVGTTRTVPLAFTAGNGSAFGAPGAPYFLFEPGAITNRQVDIEAHDNCLDPGEDFTIQQVGVDVIRIQ
jgi:hypothetical protein